MITKRSQRRSDSSFQRLAGYMIGKAREVWTRNCCEDPELGIIEIEAIQSLNTKTQADRTYHLIVSFPEGERPDLETLRAIELSLVEKIGYTEHQRLVAVHTDTRHLHMHIAISRIHPVTYNNFEPYRDHRKLFEVSRELEKKHHLMRLETGFSNNPFHPMEARQGLLSFETWVRETAREDILRSIQSGGSWDDLQNCMGRFDIHLRKHGAGLVVSHRRLKLFCKASNIDRILSLKSLEAKLGPFTPDGFEVLAETSYKPQPSALTLKASKLFAEFEEEKARRKDKKSNNFAAIRENQSEAFRRISGQHKQRKAELVRDRLIHPARKAAIHRDLYLQMREAMDELKKSTQLQRKNVRESSSMPRWVDWLCQLAEKGNIDALETLRKTKWADRRNPSGNIIRTDGIEPIIIDKVPRKLHPDGTLEYRLLHGRILDHGGYLSFPDHAEQNISEALVFVASHFGKNVAAQGSEQFLKSVSEALQEKEPAPRRDVKSPNIEL